MYCKYDDPELIKDIVKAVLDEDLANLRFYVADGVDPDMRDANGLPLLHKAAGAGKLRAAQFLLEAGASPHLKGGPSANTPLHFAAHRDDADMVDLLLRNGAGLQETNAGGETPLHSAAHRGAVDVVIQLVKAGARLDAKNHGGKTPREVADERAETIEDAPEFRQVAAFLYRAEIAPKAEQMAQEKAARNLDALRSHNPKRFKLKF